MVRVFCIVKFKLKMEKNIDYCIIHQVDLGKNIENKWYPVFGIYDDGDMRWIIKTNEKNGNKINENLLHMV